MGIAVAPKRTDRTSDAPSRIVTHLSPLVFSNGNGKGNFRTSNRQAFKLALYETFMGHIEGALTPFLFYDPPIPDPKSPWGTKEEIPFGAKAWDVHILESLKDGTNEDKYDFAEGDSEIIKYALSQDLLQRLPGNMALYSYGPGDLIAVRAKDCKLVESVLSAGMEIASYNAVDINDRYAHEAATEVHKTFNIESRAIQGDFMEGNLTLGDRNGTSLITVFGGPFANAPQKANEYNSKHKAAEYLGRLTRQHGFGTQVVMTVDTEQDPETLLKHYKNTRTFEAFVLSSFARAVHEDIILNKNYNIFDHWRMATEYDSKTKAIKLVAECKKTHTIRTEDAHFPFKKGHRMTNIISSKWGEDDLSLILHAAGFRDEQFYELKGNSKKLLIATSARNPDLSII